MSVTLAELAIKVDATEADKGKVALEGLAQAGTKAEHAAESLASAEDRLAAETRKANQAMAQTVTAANDAAQRVASLEGAHLRVANSMRTAQLAGLNLSRQFADIGVTAAMGMNPLMILIQQGPQIADAMAEMRREGVGMGAAFKSIAGDLGGVLRMLAPFTVAVGIAAGAFALFERAVDKQTKEATTWGETWQATVNVVGKHLMDGPIGDGLRWLSDQFNGFLDGITKGAFEATTRLAAFFSAAYKTIAANWSNLPALFEAIFVSAVNKGIDALQSLARAQSGVLGSLKTVLGALNPAVKAALDALKAVDLSGFKLKAGEGAGKIIADFGKQYQEDLAGIQASARGMLGEIGKEADRLHRANEKSTKAAKAHKEEVDKVTKAYEALGKKIDEEIAAQKLQQQIQADAFAAYREGAQLQQAYYQSSKTGLAGDIRLQQDLIALQKQSEAAANRVRVIQSAVGSTDATGQSITTVGQAYAQIDRLTQGNRAYAESLKARLNTAIEVTAQTDRQTQAEETAKIAIDALTQAQKQYDTALRAQRDDTYFANASPAEREARGWIELVAQIHEAAGASREYALQLATAEGLLRQQADEAARLKVELTDTFRNAFIDTGKLDFKGLRDGMTRAMRRAIYDSLIARPIDIVVRAQVQLLNQLTDSLFKPITDRLMGGLGGGLGGALGGAGALGVADSLRGMKDAAGSVQEAAGSMARSTSKIGSVLGTIGTAFATGSIGNSIAQSIGIGRGGKASNIGGMVGGAAGFFGGAALSGSIGGFGASLAGQAALTGGSTMLGSSIGWLGAAAGPIGMVVGAILGAALGGLIGGKPSNHAAIARFNSPTSFGMVSTGKETEETVKLAQTAAEAVKAATKAATDAGITFDTYIHALDIGTRDKTRVVLNNGVEFRSGAVGDPAEAANAAMLKLLDYAHYATDAQKQLVESMKAAGAGFDEIVQKLQEYAAAQQALKDIADQLLQAQNPQAYDIKVLRDTIKKQRDGAIEAYNAGLITADQLSTVNGQLNELANLKLQDIFAQYADGVQEATNSLQKFRESLDTGPNALLNPEAAYMAAQKAFADTATKARGGDAAAQGELQSVSQDFLDASKQYFASSGGYFNDLSAVKAAVDAVLALPGQTATGGDPSLAVQQQQAGLLGDINQSLIDIKALLAGAAPTVAVSPTGPSIPTSPAPDPAANPYSYTDPTTGQTYSYTFDPSMLNFSGLGFATTGSFTVGGSGGPDSQFVPLNLSPGEIVDVRRPYQATNDNGDMVSELQALRGAVARLEAQLARHGEVLVESDARNTSRVVNALGDNKTDRLASGASIA